MTARSVLLVTPRWTRDGGVAAHTVSSASALAREGVDVHAVAARIELDEPIPGVTLHHSPRLCDVSTSPEQRIADVRSLSPDVVHAHQFEDPDVLSLLHEQSPVVISVHGYSACTSGVHYFRPGQECGRAHGPGCVPNLLFRGCAHVRNPSALPASYRRVESGLQALRHADLLISYSSAVDRHLAENGFQRRVIVPYFATVPPRSAGGHATRRRVVFAGRVIKPKGVGVLVRAARRVRAEFVVCGDGRELQSMRALVRRLRISERVRFTGWLPPEQLALELAQASVVVVPSLWPEPFGLVGIEAHAAGRPAVASATGGVSDWLENGVNGLLVRPGDVRDLARALRELLDDPDRQAAMGDAGRQIVKERFSVERHLQELTHAYEAAQANWERRARVEGTVAGRAEPRAPSAT